MSDDASIRRTLGEAATAADDAANALLTRMENENDPVKAKAIQKEWKKALKVRDDANDAFGKTAFKTSGGTSLENNTAKLKDRIKKLKAEQAQWEEVAAVLSALSTAIKGVLLFV
jgi:uncharacterized protein YdcH (DUF465 family)